MAVRPPSSKPPAQPAQPPAQQQAAASPATPSLIPQGAHAGKPGMPLARPFILIGSRNRAHVHLVSHTVSRTHAAIINTDHGSYVRDLASRTHTFVNGRPVKEAPLRHSDAIQCGSFQFRFSDKTHHGPLENAPRAPRAVLRMDGVDGPVRLEALTLLIGQRPTCDLYLNDPAVSMAHAIVFELNGRHYVRDLGSRTGTFVNGHQAHQEVLEFGDEIRVGPATLLYAPADVAAESETQPPTVDEEALHEHAGADSEVAMFTGAAGAAAIGATAPDAAAPDAPDEFDLAVAGAEPDLTAAEPDLLTPEPLPIDLTATERAAVQIPSDLPPAPESEWDAAPLPVAPAPDFSVTAPVELSTEESPIPLAPEAEAAFPPLPPLAHDSSADAFTPDTSAQDAATPADVFEPASAAEEPPLPLDGAEPSLADIEALAGPSAPADQVDPTGPRVVEATPAEATPFDFDAAGFDLAPESEPPVNLTSEPFGPLTDMDLLSHLEPAQQNVPPVPPVLDAPASEVAATAEELIPAAPEAELDPIAPVAIDPAATESAASAPAATDDIPPEVMSSEQSFSRPDSFESTVAAPAPEADSPDVPPVPEAATESRTETIQVVEALSSGTAFPEVIEPAEAGELGPADITPPAPEIGATVAPDVEPIAPAWTDSASLVPPPLAPPPVASPVNEPAVEDPAAAEAAPTRGAKRKRKPAATKAAPKKTEPQKKKRLWGKKAKDANGDAETPGGAASDAATGAVAGAAAAGALAAGAMAFDAPAAEQAAPVPDETPAAQPPEWAAPTEPAPAPEESWAAAESAAEPPALVEAIETLPATEPTPESAQSLGLDDAATPVPAPNAGTAEPESATVHPGDAPPADAAFDQVLEEFSGSAAGPILEEPSTQAVEVEPQEVLEVPAVVETAGWEPHPAPPPAPAAELEPPSPPRLPPEELSATTAEDVPEPSGWAPAVADLPPQAEPRLEDLAGLLPPDSLPEEPPPAPPAPAPAPRAASAPPARTDFDPFRGMGRDEGSFIGGLPLDLGISAAAALNLSPGFGTPVAPPVPVPPPASAAPKPQAPGAAQAYAAPDVRPTPPAPAPAADLDPLDRLEDPFPRPPVSRPQKVEEPELDLELPDLSDPSADLGRPAATSGTAPAVDVFDESSLELPDFPDVPAAGASAPRATANELEFIPASAPPEPGAPVVPPAPVAPPPGATVSATTSETTASPAEETLDALSFTEEEAETLHLLPRPQAPPSAQPPKVTPPPASRATPAAPAQPVPPPPAARGGRGQKYPAKTPPPARSSMPPRRPIRSPLDLEAADLGSGFDIAPFPGKPDKGTSAPGAATPAAFSGLAMPPVREADVFSGLAFGADELPPSRGPVRVSEGSDLDLNATFGIPPAKAGGPSAAPSAAAPTGLDDADAAALGLTGSTASLPVASVAAPPGRRGGRPSPTSPREMEFGGPGRGPVPAPGAGAGAAAQPPDFPAVPWPVPGAAAGDPASPASAHRRRLGVGVLLVLMGVALVGAGAGIWFLWPKPDQEIVGNLQFAGLRDQTEYDRSRIEQEQRAILKRPDFRLRAREILKIADAKMSYGFLGEEPEALRAYDRMADTAQAVERTNNFRLYYRGTEPYSDRARMYAVLKALHAVNKPSGDKFASTQGEYERAQAGLKASTERIEALKKQVTSLREKGESVPQLEARLKKLEADDQRLRTAAAEARRVVDRLEAELRQAEARGAAGGSADDGPADPEEVARWRERLNQLEVAVAAAKAERAAKLEQAAAALQQATADFESFVNDAKRRVSAKNETQLKAAWSGDGELRRLEQYLALKQRHRNAALGGGLRREAEDLDADIATIDNEIKARRDQIARRADAGGGMRVLQHLIDRVQGDMSGAGARDAARDDAESAAGEKVPAVDNLPADQKRLAEALDQRSKHLDEARQEHAVALVAVKTLDTDLVRQEREAAALRRQIELTGPIAAYVEQDAQDAAAPAAEEVAEQDAGPQAGGEAEAAAQQGAGRRSPESVRTELAAAKKKAADAEAAAVRSYQAVLAAKAELDEARNSGDALAAAQRQRAALEAGIEKDRAKVEDLQKQVAKLVRPVEPGEDAVSASPAGEDRRPLVIALAAAGIVMAFGVMMWLTAQGGDLAPAAERGTFDVLAGPGAGGATNGPGKRPGAPGGGSDDDEQPLTV